MANEVTDSAESIACTVELSFDAEVDAGSNLTLQGKVVAADYRDLRGALLIIRDQDRAEVCRLELVEFDAEFNQTGEAVVQVPARPGDYTWSVELTGPDPEEDEEPIASETFTFSVKPHATRLEVWGVPSAIVAGDEFRVQVGVKCSAGCDQAGRMFSILDHDGTEVCQATVGSEPWPGTSSLYFAEVPLQAPATEGNFRWEVRSSAPEGQLPHSDGDRSFGVPVVSAPDSVVTVEVMDKNKQQPVPGMHVLIHPFRARTDENGIATLDVSKGSHELLVSGFRYFPYRLDIEVDEDLSIRAEVEWEERPEKII